MKYRENDENEGKPGANRKEPPAYSLRSARDCNRIWLKKLLPAAFLPVAQESQHILESRNRLEAGQLC